MRWAGFAPELSLRRSEQGDKRSDGKSRERREVTTNQKANLILAMRLCEDGGARGDECEDDRHCDVRWGGVSATTSTLRNFGFLGGGGVYAVRGKVSDCFER